MKGTETELKERRRSSSRSAERGGRRSELIWVRRDHEVRVAGHRSSFIVKISTATDMRNRPSEV
jgi:hypothetical protein